MLRLRFRTQDGFDPVWSNPWRFGSTSIQAYLDVDGGGRDYIARLFDYQGRYTTPEYGLQARVFHDDEGFTIACRATPFFDGDATYGLDIRAACLGDPSRVRAWVGMLFQPQPFLENPPTGIDVAPESGWSPWITPAGP